jgi:hypothetical protein
MIAREVCPLSEEWPRLADAGKRQWKSVAGGNCKTKRALLAKQDIPPIQVKESQGE